MDLNLWHQEQATSVFREGDCSCGPETPPPALLHLERCAELTPRWVGVKAGAPWVWGTVGDSCVSCGGSAQAPCLSSILSVPPPGHSQEVPTSTGGGGGETGAPRVTELEGQQETVSRGGTTQPLMGPSGGEGSDQAAGSG